MTAPSFFETTKVVAFSEAAGLVGVATNGAAPQRVYGLFVEAEVYGEVGEEPTENYWLKAVGTPDLDAWPKEGPRPEYIMFSSDLGQIEKVLGAIASASFVPGYDQRLAGSFDGYHNSAQTEHNDATSEECVYGLGCRVNASEAGFEMRLFSKTTTVASIVAKLSPTGVDDVLGIVSGLRQWREAKLREIEEALKEQPASTPGM